MMQRTDFETTLQAAITVTRIHADCMSELLPRLPELPHGAEYLGVALNENHLLAGCMMTLTAPHREVAVELLKTFTPEPLFFNPFGIPVFPHLRYLQGCGMRTIPLEPIFPAVFLAQYIDGDAHGHYTQLVWYHQLVTQCVMIVVQLPNDLARLYQRSMTNMPKGIFSAEPECDSGDRTATVYWPLPLDMDKWYAEFVNQSDEDEWVEVISESEQ